MILQTQDSLAEFYDMQGASIYTVHNRDLERLLFDRNLLGAGFRSACLASSRQFVRHLAGELDLDDTAELLILSKGILYQLSEAVSLELGQNLPINLIATSRIAVSRNNADIAITYSRLEAPAHTLLIGDTIASGATIVHALTAYKERSALERVWILSYAGTGVGARRIAEFCHTNSIACTFLYGLAIFGLGDNGFDISFLHPDTIAREVYKTRARAQFSGRAVSAVGWDFGSQAMAPDKYRHLCWVEAEVWGLQGAACFEVAEKPLDLSELAHERSAYSDKLSRNDM
jgi:hypothetical protein